MSIEGHWKVALLRGVNVGGVKVLMSPLRANCEALGWTDVKSYIASGNLVFRAKGDPETLARDLENAIEADIGRRPRIMILSADKFQTILAAHPFTPEKGNQSHIYFCWDEPRIHNEDYETFRTEGEELRIIDNHVHFHAPHGLGRSKLADKFHKVITGTDLTGRNLNTVRKLSELLDVL